MGCGIQKTHYKVTIPYSENHQDNIEDMDCVVEISGTNERLINYIRTYVYSVLRSYHYNDFPDWYNDAESISIPMPRINFKIKEESDDS